MDAKSHTRRILTKLFSNKFAINCSWTGRAFEKNISKFRIQNLQIISLMKRMCDVLFYLYKLGTQFGFKIYIFL